MPSRAPATEQRDVDGRRLTAFVAGFVGFLVIALAALYLIYGTAPRPPDFGTGMVAGAGPLLETDPRADRAAFDAEKARALAELAWVDRDAGIARIPIDAALAIVAASGLPERVEIAPAPADDECALLGARVPRAPQASDCRGTGR